MNYARAMNMHEYVCKVCVFTWWQKDTPFPAFIGYVTSRETFTWTPPFLFWPPNDFKKKLHKLSENHTVRDMIIMKKRFHSKRPTLPIAVRILWTTRSSLRKRLFLFDYKTISDAGRWEYARAGFGSGPYFSHAVTFKQLYTKQLKTLRKICIPVYIRLPARTNS